MVSILDCHSGDRGSIPRGVVFFKKEVKSLSARHAYSRARAVVILPLRTSVSSFGEPALYRTRCRVSPPYGTWNLVKRFGFTHPPA